MNTGKVTCFNAIRAIDEGCRDGLKLYNTDLDHRGSISPEELTQILFGARQKKNAKRIIKASHILGSSGFRVR